MARIADTSFDPAPGFDIGEAVASRIPYDQWEDTVAFKAMQERSDNLPDGEIVGGILRFPWADGAAYYLVTSARPLTVQHIAIGDAWMVPDYMLTGLKKADILAMLERDRSFARLWASL